MGHKGDIIKPGHGKPTLKDIAKYNLHLHTTDMVHANSIVNSISFKV